MSGFFAAMPHTDSEMAQALSLPGQASLHRLSPLMSRVRSSSSWALYWSTSSSSLLTVPTVGACLGQPSRDSASNRNKGARVVGTPCF